jgi:hypothetical protein
VKGAGANVGENERQGNVTSMRHVTLADFPKRGMAGGLRLRFGRIFQGVAVAPHRALARYKRSPLATIPRLKFGRIFGTAKGRSPVPWEVWELRPYERSRCAEHVQSC